MRQVSQINIRSIEPLDPPIVLHNLYPITPAIAELVYQSREEIKQVLSRKDRRMLLIIGPCSIHDPEAALDYAQRFAKLRNEVKDRLLLIMRVYFEKPRTTIGWKGLITDPQIDGLDDIPTGLRVARRLLLDILSFGVPAATEFLDPIVPQYIADLVSWAAIGARTTESQTHRQMASGLSMPVGYKNSTDGNMQIAIDAMKSASYPHSFLGIDENGKTSVVRTKGNPWGHVILRGGNNLPNYEPEFIRIAEEKLRAANLTPNIMVDCSHANSGKKHERQEVVWQSILEQRSAGNENLIGMMLESNIHEGNQKLPEVLYPGLASQLKYGVSITDACVSWETTESLVSRAYSYMAEVLAKTA